MSKRVPKKKCACGKLLRDGRCSAMPSCDDFKRHSQRALSLERRLRERERKSVAPIGLTPDAARDGYERSGLDSSYPKLRALGAERARRAWARKGVSK